MRSLIVEDDARMAELVVRGLRGEGHTVDTCGDGLRGLERAQAGPFDAVVLDVMLPGMDGLAVARRLRAAGSQVPILLLTARDSERDVVSGLDAGADDYLTKPFSMSVLTARLRAITRRARADTGAVLQAGDLTMNLETHEVRRGTLPIVLTPTEFTLLETLLRRAGRVVSRDRLLDAVWGTARDVESNTLEVFIWQVRSKVEAGGLPRLIQTVRSFGYMIREGDEL